MPTPAGGLLRPTLSEEQRFARAGGTATDADLEPPQLLLSADAEPSLNEIYERTISTRCTYNKHGVITNSEYQGYTMVHKHVHFSC